jgi:hypothetical protein
MSAFQLAQLNIAVLKYPMDGPEMKGFVDNLDRINALAESSPGFVWRLKDDAGNATALRPMGEDIIVNMSVWQDVESLNHYVYKTAHVEILRRRKEWFDRMKESHMVLWWVPAGHLPDVQEAAGNLKLLQTNGPSPGAFNFRHAFPPPDSLKSPEAFTLGDECPA